MQETSSRAGICKAVSCKSVRCWRQMHNEGALSLGKVRRRQHVAKKVILVGEKVRFEEEYACCVARTRCRFFPASTMSFFFGLKPEVALMTERFSVLFPTVRVRRYVRVRATSSVRVCENPGDT